MKLSDFFSKEQVLFLENSDKQAVFKEITLKLENLGKITSSTRYYAQIIHRESLENTGIGSGFAIPHARTDSVDDFHVIFAISKNGIEYQSFDGKAVKFILTSLFPTTHSTKYLYLVGMMARIFSVKKNRDEIESQKTVKQVYDVLSRLCESYFEDISEKSKKEIDASANLAGVPSSELDLLIRLDRLYQMYDEDSSESLSGKIDELRKLIDNRSLTYYERMRSKCQNPFAIVEKSACAGCHMNIPPIEMNAIKERNHISICSHCGRFLILI